MVGHDPVGVVECGRCGEYKCCVRDKAVDDGDTEYAGPEIGRVLSETKEGARGVRVGSGSAGSQYVSCSLAYPERIERHCRHRNVFTGINETAYKN